MNPKNPNAGLRQMRRTLERVLRDVEFLQKNVVRHVVSERALTERINRKLQHGKHVSYFAGAYYMWDSEKFSLLGDANSLEPLGHALGVLFPGESLEKLS